MESFLKHLYSFAGGIYVPSSIITSSVKIVHISDTPFSIFDKLIKMVKKIEPDIIIHTGDISDDIKLELMPEYRDKYKKQAGYFVNQLAKYASDKLIIVPGNHDDIEALELPPKVMVVNEGSSVTLYGYKIGLSHNFERLPEGCDFYLFGHCRTSCSKNVYLNGINYINIVKIPEGDVLKLPYPIGTDDYRFKKTKIGL